jgi:mRNA interferase HigB
MHADAEQSLLEWYHTTKNCDWQNFAEMRDTFGSVDSAGNDRFVFNIKGNHYRLVAIVIFAARKVFIRFIGTHAEYDKINASTV